MNAYDARTRPRCPETGAGAEIGAGSSRLLAGVASSKYCLQKQVLQRQALAHGHGRALDPTEHIGLLIGAVRRRIKQAVGERVQTYSLTAQQFWVLVAIHELKGLSLRELATRLRMDEPTASRVVTALIARQLVRVENDPSDRRRSRLHLGPTGSSLGEELHEVAAEIRNAVVRGLSAAEKNAVRSALRKIITNMDRLNHAAAPRAVPRRTAARRRGSG
jgi:DNA-binding MarR family transcriptional regulator